MLLVPPMVVQPPSALPAPIAYWPLNGNTNDASGNGHNGSAWSGYASGLFGKQAASFTANGSITGTGVNIANGPFSVAAWLESTGTGNAPGWVNIGSVSANNQQMHGFYRTNGTFNMKFGLFANDLEVSTIDISSSMGHFVFVLDASKNQLIYANGSQYGSRVSSSFFTGDTAWTIGDSPAAGSQWYGLIQEVRVYDVALTSSQVTTLYNLVP